MSSKLIQAVQRAGNFSSGAVQPVEQPFVSEAQHRGIGEPPKTPAELAGVGVESVLASRYLDSLRAVERYQADKAAYEAAQDDALWAQIQARQGQAIG